MLMTWTHLYQTKLETIMVLMQPKAVPNPLSSSIFYVPSWLLYSPLCVWMSSVSMFLHWRNTHQDVNGNMASSLQRPRYQILFWVASLMSPVDCCIHRYVFGCLVSWCFACFVNGNTASSFQRPRYRILFRVEFLMSPVDCCIHCYVFGCLVSRCFFIDETHIKTSMATWQQAFNGRGTQY